MGWVHCARMVIDLTQSKPTGADASLHVFESIERLAAPPADGPPALSRAGWCTHSRSLSSILMRNQTDASAALRVIRPRNDSQSSKIGAPADQQAQKRPVLPTVLNEVLLEFRDPIGVLTPIDVSKYCASIGLPRPLEVMCQGGRGRSVVYKLTFSERSGQAPRALWMELAPGVLGSALQHESVALAHLGSTDSVPTHAPFTASPKRALKRWTGNRPYHNGALAIEWLPEHPQDWPALASVLGRTLIHLQTVSMPHFGLMVNDGQFHSSQSSWPAAWEAYVLALTERAVERGVDMGPHTRRLAHAIANQIQALEANTRWTLVHGNLGPQSLEVLTGPEKTAPCLVTGWEEACAGDRLIDVAALLGLSAEQLGPVLAEVDDELIASWLHPESLRRIEVYHWTWCLAQLCIIGDYYGFDRRLARLGNLGRGCRRPDQRPNLQPRFH